MICESCQFENSPESLTCERCQKILYRAKLLITSEMGLEKTVHLFSKNYTIGREEDNDIVIDHVSVSRHHAEIRFVNNLFQIEDRDSKNGSLLNNNHFKNRILHDRDRIQLGTVQILFYDEIKSPESSQTGLDTEQWVQKEFSKFAHNKETRITTDEVLLTMLDLATSLIHAERALILQFDQANKLRFKVGKKQLGAQLFGCNLSEYDWTIINDAIRKKSVNFVTAGTQTDTENTAALEQAVWRKLALPLMASKIKGLPMDSFGLNGILGVVYFTQNKSKHIISKRKNELLSTILLRIAYAVQNDMLYDQALEKRKFEKDLFIAREIQERLLPTSTPSLNNFEIANFTHPCETVSGDYCDFIPVSSSTIAITIGDICGKGVPAALLTSTVQAAIHSQLEFTTSPNQIVQNLNRLLLKSTAESIFLTLFFGILHVDSGEFKYLNAGHPPPIFISNNLTIAELASTSPPLGILEVNFDSEKVLKFNKGDILLLYTDGIIESQNLKKQLYGRRKLLKFIESVVLNNNMESLKLNDILEQINADIHNFMAGASQTDDITLLAVKRR
ncbi:MAG: SpoIIE family protein phosphatase [bacterium]